MVSSIAFLTSTSWKVSKYGVFSGPYFPAFGLNTERYSVSLRIQSECGRIRSRKNSVFGHFSRSEIFSNFRGVCSQPSVWVIEAVTVGCSKNIFEFSPIFMSSNSVFCINITSTLTAWKVPKYGVISGPYFPLFGLNTERYGESLCIQSNYRKIRTRNNSVFGRFSRSVWFLNGTVRKCLSIKIHLVNVKKSIDICRLVHI